MVESRRALTFEASDVSPPPFPLDPAFFASPYGELPKGGRSARGTHGDVNPVNQPSELGVHGACKGKVRGQSCCPYIYVASCVSPAPTDSDLWTEQEFDGNYGMENRRG